MRVKDLAAELISEIAEEHGYYVYKFEKVSSGCGYIVYETTFVDDESGSDDEVVKFKSINYNGSVVELQYQIDLGATVAYADAAKQIEIYPPDNIVDLHDPESVQKIHEYFDDLNAVFDSACGLGMPVFNSISTYSPGHISSPGHVTITTAPPPTPPPNLAPPPSWNVSPPPVVYGNTYISPAPVIYSHNGSFSMSSRGQPP